MRRVPTTTPKRLIKRGSMVTMWIVPVGVRNQLSKTEQKKIRKLSSCGTWSFYHKILVPI